MKALLFLAPESRLTHDRERGKCVLCGLGKHCPGHRSEVLKEARKLYEATNPSQQPRLF